MLHTIIKDTVCTIRIPLNYNIRRNAILNIISTQIPQRIELERNFIGHSVSWHGKINIG